MLLTYDKDTLGWRLVTCCSIAERLHVHVHCVLHKGCMAACGEHRCATSPESVAVVIAAEIYYSAATTAQNVAFYNALYSGFFGGQSTFDQILAREADRVVGQGLLLLSPSPHMFHQVRQPPCLPR
jgi:hypothetical protein